MDYTLLIQQLGYKQLHSAQKIQTLWGGYGELVRLFIDDMSIIVKHITLPEIQNHPRGWNTTLSHQRKVLSYQVELHWYQDFAPELHANCPAPLPIKVVESESTCLLVMQDLQQLGYNQTTTEANNVHLNACLKWLAWFHATHIENEGKNLWDIGTYWHIETRPDELEALEDSILKEHAQQLDQILKGAPFQTLVHGDAKLANFCFTADGEKAAAVDFQYVGKGCAMKDVALFMSSAVTPQQCAQKEQWILDTYFRHLKEAIKNTQPNLNAQEVESAWRSLFCIAWADFQRFVKGWCPTHWKINDYTEALTNQAIQVISNR
ncbi:phosphotransferase [Vibrio inusitatus NBRC 102082]|uniref:Phosphotransferase n=1 Tax=Vibrio inusitatus NBRC 102082 TaxID=1219070 RepID=A0A4Y3HXP0_9VIBR|nr:aminoglycoside phosphotransferase family protein [Vibrio inusitatus]GEA51741.1 phosphotransferase [Vibrio inusitatus NBRC 102082]